MNRNSIKPLLLSASLLLLIVPACLSPSNEDSDEDDASTLEATSEKPGGGGSGGGGGGGGGKQYTLTVAPPSHGNVTGNGINCGTAGTACSVSLATNTAVTLTVSADAGYRSGVWTGCTAGADNTCSLAMTTNTNVTVAFVQQVQLTVNVGTGGTAMVDGASCSTSCTYTYDLGTAVALTANPASDWQWGQWGGTYPTGASSTTITLTQPATMTAGFQRRQALLYSVGVGYGGTLTLTGTSSSTSTNPNRSVTYTCNGDLNQCATGSAWSFDQGSTVTVTATPHTGGYGFYLQSWSGMAAGRIDNTVGVIRIKNLGTENQILTHVIVVGGYYFEDITASPYSVYRAIGAVFGYIVG